MRQLLPVPRDTVDPYDAFRPDDPHQPFVRVNMIATVDGAAQDSRGRAGGLAGPADRELFRAMRALADVILVGAGTVRVERYGPHRLSGPLAERRRGDGRHQPAAIAVVTSTCDLDLTAPLFTEATTPTIVVTCSGAPAEARAAAERAGRVVVVGDDHVDLPAALAVLREELGLPHVLCEGGPHLNDVMLGQALADELCLTLAPLLGGSGHLRIVARLDEQVPLTLHAAYEEAGEMFLRYAVTPHGVESQNSRSSSEARPRRSS